MLVTSLGAYAEERQVLLGGEVTHGGFGGPELRFTSLNGEMNPLIGGKGAWLINQRWMLGGAGFGSTRRIDDTSYRLGYGGLMVGRVFNPQNLLHFSVELLAGAGGISEDHAHDQMGQYDNGDSIVIAEPGIYSLINLAEFAKVSLGLSYRWVNGVDKPGLSNSDLSGLSFNLAVLFGRF
jgi:hypothetical protein